MGVVLALGGASTVPTFHFVGLVSSMALLPLPLALPLPLPLPPLLLLLLPSTIFIIAATNTIHCLISFGHVTLITTTEKRDVILNTGSGRRLSTRYGPGSCTISAWPGMRTHSPPSCKLLLVLIEGCLGIYRFL